MNSDKPLSNLYKGLFLAIFFSTGLSALIFQIIWQRVLTLHAGVDLYSVTTIVAAFMAGLGLGSLFGGYIADRLSIMSCFVIFSISNCIVGIFGFFSLWLFYDVYNAFVHYLDSTFSSFLFHFVLLCIPTTFMGLSLPLLSKALVRTNIEMSSLIGTLYGMNTLGAAIGAFLGSWYLLGTFGFITCTQIASSINIICGILVVLILFRLRAETFLPVESSPIKISPSSYMDNPEKEWILMNKPTIWILIYGVTGFAALSLEIVWFRLLNVLSGSMHVQSSYAFGNFLFVYLSGAGLGSLLSSRIIKRIKRPDKLFFWMQYLIGLLSLLSIIYLPKSEIIQYVNSLNFYGHFRTQDIVRHFLFLFIPAIFILGLPTLFMGICFPLIQRIVSNQINTIGRNLSKILFSNIMGNILGSLTTGFFLLNYFGTSKTLIILCALLTIPGIIGGYCIKDKMLRFSSITAVSILSFVVIAFFPKDKDLWAFYQSIKAEEDFSFVEDRTSLSGLAKFRKDNKEYMFQILTNGQRPSSIPFGGIHSILGIAPSLYHQNPKTGLVIGFGSGDTLYSMALDERLEKITCVELSEGQYAVVQRESMREPLLWQAAKIFHDPRIQLLAGDGRKFLLDNRDKFDLIEIDAIIPMNAYSGNLYSVEFFELIKQHLKPGGFLIQWTPTSRVENSVMKVFPYVLRFENVFVIASNEPFNFSKSEVIEHLENIDFLKVYGKSEGTILKDYFTKTFPDSIQTGNFSKSLSNDFNFDLFPKDEYFLNNR